MKKFIGTKIIKADPDPITWSDHYKKMGWAWPEGKKDADRVGYTVGYPDAAGNFNGDLAGGCDYISWSPADVFEASYHECEGVSFGVALDALKLGRAVRLPRWDEDVKIKAQFPDSNSKMTAPYLYVESRFGLVPWKETMIELFSEDWMIVD